MIHARFATSLALSLTLAVGAAACGSTDGSATPSNDGARAPASAAPTAAGPSPSASAPPSVAPTPVDPAGSAEPSGGSAAAAALAAYPWATVPLVDARTGEAFTIQDLAGKVVFVESMAIWCSNCRAQQRTAIEAMAALDPERVVWLALDVDPSESTADLARYADQNGFPHRYAVAPTELARALAADFGTQVVNPPSVPIVLVGADGSVEPSFGHLGVDDIVATARAKGA